MYYVMAHNLPYGMMVTASHNPAIYNGIKVFTRGGRDANEVQTAEIEEYIAKVEEEIAAGTPIAAIPYEQAVAEGKVVEFNPLNEYLDNIIAAVDVEAIKNKGLRVALDPCTV